MTDRAFVPFPKIPRLFREIVITEKIDGTNASLSFDESGPDSMLVGSRNRWITPDNDNFGFAGWAVPRRDALFALLGPGHHFGEWYGVGIQRVYGLHERRFALFNTKRWFGVKGEIAAKGFDLQNVECVPVLYEGSLEGHVVRSVLSGLRDRGSCAVTGFMNPEGIVVYHKAANQTFKVTLDDNDNHKGTPSAEA